MSRTASQELDSLNLKASARQVNFWCERGYIESTVHGTGHGARTFTDGEKRALKLMDRLVDAGFRPEAAHKIMRATLAVTGERQAADITLKRGIQLQVRDI